MIYKEHNLMSYISYIKYDYDVIESFSNSSFIYGDFFYQPGII